MKQQVLTVIAMVFSALLFTSCYEEIVTNGLYDWEDESHSNDFEPNYEVVFNQNKVNRIDIVLTETAFNEMQLDMNTLASTQEAIINPKYFACDFYFNGIQWYDVGIRYKGNKKAYASFLNGNGKLPFKLNFDEFETQNSDLKKQRFYGFQELSLEPNFNDNSLMREKIASDLYRQFGVPASKTAYYEVYVDKGNGIPVYFGLYTMTEDVEDTLLNRVFLTNTGNCFKADGDGAKFENAIFTLDSFENITNKENPNKEEVQQLNEILNSSLRFTNFTEWQTNLESIFDVDGFLKYLAVNNTIQHWNTYGNKKENYYLYNDPNDNLLKWVVDSTNEALKSSGEEAPTTISMFEVSKKWTLIYNLIRVKEYELMYKNHIRSFINSSFTQQKMDELYAKNKLLIAASVEKESINYTQIQGGFSAFETEVERLINHTAQRLLIAENYIK